VIRALFFDAGGTLLTPAEPVGRIYARLAQARGWRAREGGDGEGISGRVEKEAGRGSGLGWNFGKRGLEEDCERECDGVGNAGRFPF